MLWLYEHYQARQVREKIQHVLILEEAHNIAGRSASPVAGECIDCGPQCGRWSRCGGIGGRLGPQYGGLADFKPFEELKEAYGRQMEYWVKKMVAFINATEIAHRRGMLHRHDLFGHDFNVERAADFDDRANEAAPTEITMRKGLDPLLNAIGGAAGQSPRRLAGC